MSSTIKQNYLLSAHQLRWREDEQLPDFFFGDDDQFFWRLGNLKLRQR
ncbi:MAG: hypothetical protein F6J86_29320 [Symploca sp. SIO1B1]|nr:hypothetical protein [Symploca sp. SIO1C2]NER97898.1 hypothetical protein [Symploca sp. SIO1B1]